MEPNQDRKSGDVARFGKSKNQLKKHNKKKHQAGEGEKLCNHCDTKFNENCDLELHLKTHLEAEIFICEVCEKTFVSKWRLRKHVSGHQGKIFCHYFNNRKSCPYEELGCMFQHEDSPICRFQEQCLKELCQYKHKDNNEKNEKDVIAETEMSNCCKKCNFFLQTMAI